MKLSVYAMLIMGAFLGLKAAEPVLVEQKAPTIAERRVIRKKADRIGEISKQISFESNHIGRHIKDKGEQVVLLLQNKQKTEKRNNS